MTNIKNIITFMFLWLFALQNNHAQQLFYSQLLNDLYNALPKTCKIETHPTDTILFCKDIIKGNTFPIVYNWDENKVLTHIGCRFMFGIDTLITNHVVVKFIEREILNLLISKNIDRLISAYKENGLVISLNNIPVKRNFYQHKHDLLQFVKDISEIAVSDDNRRYEVLLTSVSGDRLSFHFEADSELISGMDKKERDISLALQLKNHRVTQAHMLSVDSGYLKLLRDSLYVDKGNSYMIPQINNNLYYVKADSTYNLAFEKSLIAETFANAMLVPAKNKYTINIAHRIYSEITMQYSVNSFDFDDFFLRDYERYFGVESLAEEKLTGTLILHNRYFRCIHLIYVSVKLEDLLNGDTVDMELYSNIPQHNIGNLLD